MADPHDYKDLKNKWIVRNHPVGDPVLDALISIESLSGRTRQEKSMGDGSYFTASLQGVDRPIDGVPTYVVVVTGDKYHILEDMTISIDYKNVTDGNISVTTGFYASDSNKSDFTVVGGTEINMGVPLNLDYVNVLSTATFNFDSDVTINSGDPDFIVYSSQYYKDTSGNRETIGGLESSFFEDGRKLILSPNKTYVFRSTSSGNAVGTVDSLTQFSFSEMTVEEAVANGFKQI